VPSTGRAPGRAETLVSGACSPCRADLWLLVQRSMLQGAGAAPSTPSPQGVGTGMLWASLSHSLSQHCWESRLPGTQAEQPRRYCISRLCLSFPIATNSLGVCDTFVKQRNSSTGPRDMVCLQPEWDFFPVSRWVEYKTCFFPLSKGQLSCCF